VNHHHEQERQPEGASTRQGLQADLEAFINYFNLENGSKTRGFLLADYLEQCLLVFDTAMEDRDTWYGTPCDQRVRPPLGREARALAAIIHEYGLEHFSNTPDFLLAEYLLGCLSVFDYAINDRNAWQGYWYHPGLAPPRSPGDVDDVCPSP
jgi:hypothetical protein